MLGIVLLYAYLVRPSRANGTCCCRRSAATWTFNSATWILSTRRHASRSVMDRGDDELEYEEGRCVRANKAPAEGLSSLAQPLAAEPTAVTRDHQVVSNASLLLVKLL